VLSPLLRKPSVMFVLIISLWQIKLWHLTFVRVGRVLWTYGALFEIGEILP